MQRYPLVPYVQKLLDICPVHIRPEGPWLAGGSVRLAYWEDDLNTKSDLDVWHAKGNANPRTFGTLVGDEVNKNLKDPQAIRTWNFNNNRYISYYDDRNKRETQYIDHRSWDSVEELIESFDFTVCQFATDGKYVYVGDQTLQDCKDRVLRIPDTAKYLSEITFSRIEKYKEKGFTPHKDTLLKLHDLKKKGTLPKCGWYDNTDQSKLTVGFGPVESTLPKPVYTKEDGLWTRREEGAYPYNTLYKEYTVTQEPEKWNAWEKYPDGISVKTEQSYEFKGHRYYVKDSKTDNSFQFTIYRHDVGDSGSHDRSLVWAKKMELAINSLLRKRKKIMLDYVNEMTWNKPITVSDVMNTYYNCGTYESVES